MFNIFFFFLLVFWLLTLCLVCIQPKIIGLRFLDMLKQPGFTFFQRFGSGVSLWTTKRVWLFWILDLFGPKFA
jgi:hypothetical protein